MSLGGTDLNLLKALEVLLEESHVTRAGRRLNMRQPAMSAALARLRRQFGDELLLRSGREFELSPLAVELLPSVRTAQRLIDEALMTGERFDPSISTKVFRLAMSDYAMSVVYQPLMRRVAAQAPDVSIEFDFLDPDSRGTNQELIHHDLMIGPMGGYGFPGSGEALFVDDMVCLVDRDNPAVLDHELTTQDLADLPFVLATFGRGNPTPTDRILGQLGLSPHVQVLVSGWLPVPFIVEHTGMVAIVPRRLADQFCTAHTNLAVVEPPFGGFDLVEGFWVQPARSDEPAQRWLVGLMRDLVPELSELRPGLGAREEQGDLVAGT